MVNFSVTVHFDHLTPSTFELHHINRLIGISIFGNLLVPKSANPKSKKYFQILLLVNVTHQKRIDRNDLSSNESDSTAAPKTHSTKDVKVTAKSDGTKSDQVATKFLKRFYLATKPKPESANSSQKSIGQKRYKPGYWLPQPEEAETFNYSVVPVQARYPRTVTKMCFQ